MKTGDIVHVPSDVVLIRTNTLDAQLDIEATVYFKTKYPKKALVVDRHPVNETYICIEYGENTWQVSKRDITLMEFENDC